MTPPFETAYETIVCDVPRPGIAWITLNRPSAMNAYTFCMCQELTAAIATYREDDALKVLVLTGAGKRAFCTGGDISGSDPEHREQVATQPMGHGREMREGMQAVVLALRRLDKPSVAMIRGYAVAGGLALATGCDLRLAGASAKLGDTSGKAGLLPDEGGAWLFPRAMGLDRALKMTWLTRSMTRRPPPVLAWSPRLWLMKRWKRGPWRCARTLQAVRRWRCGWSR